MTPEAAHVQWNEQHSLSNESHTNFDRYRTDYSRMISWKKVKIHRRKNTDGCGVAERGTCSVLGRSQVQMWLRDRVKSQQHDTWSHMLLTPLNDDAHCTTVSKSAIPQKQPGDLRRTKSASAQALSSQQSRSGHSHTRKFPPHSDSCIPGTNSSFSGAEWKKHKRRREGCRRTVQEPPAERVCWTSIRAQGTRIRSSHSANWPRSSAGTHPSAPTRLCLKVLRRWSSSGAGAADAAQLHSVMGGEWDGNVYCIGWVGWELPRTGRKEQRMFRRVCCPVRVLLPGLQRPFLPLRSVWPGDCNANCSEKTSRNIGKCWECEKEREFCTQHSRVVLCFWVWQWNPSTSARIFGWSSTRNESERVGSFCSSRMTPDARAALSTCLRDQSSIVFQNTHESACFEVDMEDHLAIALPFLSTPPTPPLFWLTSLSPHLPFIFKEPNHFSSNSQAQDYLVWSRIASKLPCTTNSMPSLSSLCFTRMEGSWLIALPRELGEMFLNGREESGRSGCSWRREKNLGRVCTLWRIPWSSGSCESCFLSYKCSRNVRVVNLGVK